jgi:hypothetical protein
MTTKAGAGTGFLDNIIKRLKTYNIAYKDSDGNPNIHLTNLELISYIQTNFDKNYDLDTKKYPLNKTDTTVFLLDFIDTKTSEEDIKKNKSGVDGNGVDSNDNEPKEMPKKEKNNKIIVGLSVKPTDKQNSKGYLMNDFNIFTVYNSLPYSNIDNVDDFLKSFFKFIQTKRDDNGKIESYDNNDKTGKKNITYIVVDPANYKNKNESNVEKKSDEKSKKGIDSNSNSDSEKGNDDNDDDNDNDNDNDGVKGSKKVTVPKKSINKRKIVQGVLSNIRKKTGGKKKTQKKSNKNRKNQKTHKTQKRQKKQKS